MKTKKICTSIKKILLDRRYDEPLPFIQVSSEYHLVSYFPLIYGYGANKNRMHFLFTRAKF